MKWKADKECGDKLWMSKGAMGEFAVEFAPWIRPDKPWIVIWYPVGTRGDTTIGHRASDLAGKRLAESFCKRIAVAAKKVAGE